jgi:hypothetical protein
MFHPPRSGAMNLDVGFNPRTAGKHFLVALATVEWFALVDTIECSIVADATGLSTAALPRVKTHG